ncbi:MAG: galactokinase [Dehalococcoidia bacterium]
MVQPAGLPHGFVPTVAVRAPGRVNLIGEHTDYSFLPVLPIAIDRGLLIHALPLDRPVVEAGSDRFPGPIAVTRGAPYQGETWGRYLAGALAELEDLAPDLGARIHISGDLPAEGGLSSSSALTTGVIAALLTAWDLPIDREELVARAIRAERHVGVETGGMDQEAIVFAEPGCALRIDFEPKGRRFVPLPAGLRFVVASSGEEAPKGGAARDAYNERVIGTRLAAAMLCDTIGAEFGKPPRLADVIGFPEAELLVEELPIRMAPSSVSRSTGIPLAALSGIASGSMDDRALYTVRPYARHVFNEAARVDQAEAALTAGDLPELGGILNASHKSLRDDYGCSTPALDALCTAMREAGALGARLTGAGFGGFALAAVEPGRVAEVIEAATALTGGPAFEVTASGGLSVERL